MAAMLLCKLNLVYRIGIGLEISSSLWQGMV